MTQLAPTPRTKLKRRAQRGSFDREVVNAILDEGFVCSVAFLHDGKPCVIPTLYARGGDFLILHGSPANRMLRSLCEPGHEACISVFHADALVLARSAFHHSINYRSVVLYAQAEEVVDADEKLEAMRVVVEHVVPGRWKDVRSPNLEEFRGTLVLRAPDRRGLGQDPRPGRDRRRGGPPARLLGGAAPDGDPLRDSAARRAAARGRSGPGLRLGLHASALGAAMRARARANSDKRDRVQEIARRARRLARAGARVRALEHDAELERRPAPRTSRSPTRRAPTPRRSARTAPRIVGQPPTPASGAIGPRRSPPSPGQVATSQPRSSSGSPIVHISQSTIAASRGPSFAKSRFAKW